MGVPEWIEMRLPAFGHISEDERTAILHFALLWTLFEAQVLDRAGNVARIAAVCGRWAERGLIRADTFSDDLAYFRNRYWEGGDVTDRFRHLNLTQTQEQQVRSVLGGATEDPSQIALGLLTIVYRFRNNLFHGEKWSYQLQGQLGNFSHANALLMKSIEIHSAV